MPDLTNSPDFKTMTMAEKIAHLKAGQEALKAISQTHQNMVAVQNAEMHAAFGFSQDKPLSVIDMLNILSGLQQEKTT